MEDYSSLFGLPAGTIVTNGIGNSSVPLSTPVNTSANGGNSGSFFGSLISGLQGLGTAALNGYKDYSQATTQPTTVTGTVASALGGISSTVWIILGGVGLLVALILFRRK